MADVDAPLKQQVFYISALKGGADIHHDHEPNDLKRRIEIPKRAFVLGHRKQIKPLSAGFNLPL